MVESTTHYFRIGHFDATGLSYFGPLYTIPFKRVRGLIKSLLPVRVITSPSVFPSLPHPCYNIVFILPDIATRIRTTC